MMNTLLTGWNIMRVLRLVIGIVIIGQGIQASEWILVVMGGLFSLMPLFNVGCCGVGGCSVPDTGTQHSKTDHIDYEEIK